MSRNWLNIVGACAILLAGCPGKTKTETVLPPEADKPAVPTQDQAIALEEQKIQGVFFEPQAAKKPLMLVAGGVKGTVEQARKRYAKAKNPDMKVVEAMSLVTLLWSSPATRQEAVKVLRESAVLGTAPEPLVRMAAVAEHIAGDRAKAAAAYDDLIARFPQSKDAGLYKAYRAWIALTDGDNAKAAEIVGATDPAAAETPAEAAYAIAWVRFRKGDVKGAWDAMGAAAVRWTYVDSLPELRSDLLMMAGRANVEVATVVTLLEGLAAKDQADLRATIDALTQAYHFGGHYARCNETLDRRAEGAPPAILAEVRFLQAYIDLRLGQPKQAAERILAAWTAATEAGDAVKAETRDAIAGRIKELAQFDHVVYAKSFDPAYGDAADKLYAAYMALPDRTDNAEVKGYQDNLKATVADVATLDGLHDKDDINRRLLLRREEVAACYERALQGQPTLAGQIKLTFDVAHEGKVTVAAPEPAAGPDGMGLVAGCVTERAKAWVFPARKTPGITRVVVPFTFSPVAR